MDALSAELGRRKHGGLQGCRNRQDGDGAAAGVCFGNRRSRRSRADQRAQGPAAAMLPRKPYYRESSAKAVLIAIRERAAPAAGEGRVKLITAVGKLGGVAPWAAIVEGIVTGALQIRTDRRRLPPPFLEREIVSLQHQAVRAIERRFWRK
ncbi:hypothetical protein ABIB00_003911 [Bradyrhizobium sp. LB14.3]|uniref:hypothetical protein n=1 Tax=Bradyrhizobium sp. LB14.3 TaxID=3156328 RepID=UPI003390DE95